MPQSIPDMRNLVAVAAKYLENELLPTLAGYHRFKTRVTINVLNVIQRELEVGAAQSTAERAQLTAIMGHEGSLETLNDELSEAIRSGAITMNDRELRAHIRRSLADALAINNPRWVTD
jgi:Domain of unknown function (DUF6285)